MAVRRPTPCIFAQNSWAAFFTIAVRLPAIALNTDQAILTALSNDYCYESVFSRQVEALARPGDVVWGISTSGNSKNVVEALAQRS